MPTDAASMELQDEWLARYEAIALGNRKRLQLLRELFAAWDAVGVEAIPIKGVDWLLRSYPGLGERSMDDCDIVVRPSDVDLARAVLGQRGLTEFQHRRPLIVESFFNQSLDYQTPGGEFEIDLAWNLWFDSGGRFRRRLVWRETAIGRRRLLHPHDALNVLVIDAVARRGYFSPFFVPDLRRLLAAEAKELDWPAWVRENRAGGQQAALYHGLRYARQAGVEQIPESILRAL
ncbi:MAG TPA: nucleotidyltransferase family protein, partial [Elusimicrobiota bacterium]|nr:nucleotidyltransferase family protein [Elusimicrobiota bacterium]